MASTAPGPQSRPTSSGRVALVLLAAVLVGGAGYLANRARQHVERLNTQIGTLEEALAQTTVDAEAAAQRAATAERSAIDATASAAQSQANAEQARQDALDSDARANLADRRATDAVQTSIKAEEEARRAREEADEIRRVAEAEMNRLTEALGQIAETRRTALGLVMSLDEGYLKFDFDQAELRPESRELLSRIAGILFTATDSAITITGHTDTRGEVEYNQELSERRARAVADYLIAAGLPADLFTVEGLGMSQLVDPGDTTEAHSKNRRVELGIVNARIIESYANFPAR
ncbi:MAG: OmpA family protein [Acidobacteriota bacterium]|nr:OmpA family protein [Acidobacteriota bacterium]